MLFKYIKKSLKKVAGLTLSIYLILSVFVVSRAETYEWTVINSVGKTIETNSSEIEESEKANANVKDKETVKTDELNLQCESAILIEQNSGQVLYEKNSHEQLRPASVTKLMSLLLIFEALESRSNHPRRPSTMQ